jgi:hypothetical protein
MMPQSISIPRERASGLRDWGDGGLWRFFRVAEALNNRPKLTFCSIRPLKRQHPPRFLDLFVEPQGLVPLAWTWKEHPGMSFWQPDQSAFNLRVSSRAVF